MTLSATKSQVHKRICELEDQQARKNDAIAGLEKKIKKAKTTMDCQDSDESWDDIVARREEDLKKAER